MTDKELRRLNRKELLEMMIELEKENLRLQSELEEATAQLADRELHFKKAGSIAEAALAVNEVFTAAEAAAKQYLESIRLRSERQKAVCDRLLANARAQADAIIREAELEKIRRINEADESLRDLRSKTDSHEPR